ncbi:MAG: NfeD family protein [Phycisphaerales bacterium]
MDTIVDIFFANGAAWFTAPALIGTLGYLFRMLVATFGGGDGHADAAHHDSDAMGGHWGATMLSVQGLLTFAMGFGWGGLGAYRGAGWSAVVSVFVGLVCGVGFVGLLIALFRATRRLQTSGNVSLDQFVGVEAEAYTAIPPPGGGKGQISAVVGDRQRYIYAVSEANEIPARTRLRVIRANGDNTVTVRRA